MLVLANTGCKALQPQFLKCFQPDCSFLPCDDGGEGFEGLSLLQYTFKGNYKSECLLAFEDSAGKSAVLQILPCCP